VAKSTFAATCAETAPADANRNRGRIRNRERVT
jgi:hypothetical protein